MASGGGHWVQLQRLLPAFEGHEVAFLTTEQSYRAEVPGYTFFFVRDANRTKKIALLLAALKVLGILLRFHPDVVVTTGAAPGYLALRLGRSLGARGVWVDSLANAAELSLSGKLAGKSADLWLTQWPHLSVPGGPEYHGSVL